MTAILRDPLDNPLRERKADDPWEREDDNELFRLYQLGRVAKADVHYADRRWHAMQWAATEYNRKHPAVSSTGAYKRLDYLLEYNNQ